MLWAACFSLILTFVYNFNNTHWLPWCWLQDFRKDFPCYGPQVFVREPILVDKSAALTKRGFLLSKFVKLQVCMLPKCHNLSTDFRTVFVFTLEPFLPCNVGTFFHFNRNFNRKIALKSLFEVRFSFLSRLFGGGLGPLKWS